MTVATALAVGIMRLRSREAAESVHATAAADARAAHETAKAERTISEFSALAEERAKPWWRRIVG